MNRCIMRMDEAGEPVAIMVDQRKDGGLCKQYRQDATHGLVWEDTSIGEALEATVAPNDKAMRVGIVGLEVFEPDGWQLVTAAEYMDWLHAMIVH